MPYAGGVRFLPGLGTGDQITKCFGMYRLRGFIKLANAIGGQRWSTLDVEMM